MLKNTPLTMSTSVLRCFCGSSALVIAVSFGALGTNSAIAQEQPNPQDDAQHADAAQKVIHEPIHRVPKVASAANSILNAVSGLATSVPRFAPVDAMPIAENAEPGIPAILPSSVAPFSEPPIEASVAEPAPSRKMIPAIPASMVKPVPVAKPTPHPLDDALETARRGLENIQSNVTDYSAIMVKRERVDGKLQKPEYMQVKVRSEGVSKTGGIIPFSVYMKFIKPRACAGREVIWVKGRNNNQLCAHEGSGLLSLKRLNLEPDGWVAMKGQRYPIYEAGMENLVVKLIEKAERDKAAGQCNVEYRDGVKINGRECSVIEVTHPDQRAPYDFHIAKVYIDKELRLPIRYQAHTWPEPGSTKPLLLEEYTYLNVKINQGFTDQDFNPDNPAYSYPNR